MMKDQGLPEAIVDEIVRKVMAQLGGPSRTALVCFSGAGIGSREALDALGRLRDEGWKFRAFMSDGALQALDPEDVKKNLGVSRVETNKDHAPLKELRQGVDEIILATMTVNTAAKIAAGVCDSPMLTMIAQAIMAGEHFTCAIDGAWPESPGRAALGMGKAPEAYRQRMRRNLADLSSYGMKLVAAEDLHDACAGTPVEGTIGKGAPEAADRPAPAAEQPRAPASEAVKPAAPVPAVSVLEKHIISRVDICRCRGQKTVKVAADAIVTGFAADAAKEFGMTIERL